MPEYKLTYFDSKALGEVIRFILSYGGVDFQDIRIDRSTSWTDIKPRMPYGQLPILEIDGKVYHQTLPICRYLAKQFDIGGKTDLDALEIDAIANSIYDFRKTLAPYYWDKNPVTKAEKREAILNVTIPFYMKRFDDLVRKNGGYFHGGELSYADLFFAAVCDHMNGFMGFEVIEDYPNLRQTTNKVLALPRIAAWIAKRPKTDI